MPKAAKRFISQCPRANTSLSINPKTIRVYTIHQSQIGFTAEEHHIKTKYRTKLAYAQRVLLQSIQYINGSVDDRNCMEVECRMMIQ